MKPWNLVLGLVFGACIVLPGPSCQKEGALGTTDDMERQARVEVGRQSPPPQKGTVTFLTLPKPKSSRLGKIVSKGLVSARFGGVQKLNHGYTSVDGKQVNVTATVYFPPA